MSQASEIAEYENRRILMCLQLIAEEGLSPAEAEDVADFILMLEDRWATSDFEIITEATQPTFPK